MQFTHRNKVNKSIIREFIISLSRPQRRFIFLFLDILILFCSTIYCIKLRPNFIDNLLHLNFIGHNNSYNWFIPVLIIVAIFTYIFTGQYKDITRYIGFSYIYRFFQRSVLVIILTITFGYTFRFSIPSFNKLFLLLNLITILTFTSRMIVRLYLIKFVIFNSKDALKVAIYGAGSAGSKLASLIKFQKNYHVKMFFDDDDSLVGSNINGIRIESSKKIDNYRNSIDQILLAIPSLNRERRKQILKKSQIAGFKALQVPSLEDITSGRSKIDELKPILIEDLLGRDSVDMKFLLNNVTGFNICITGAGGSIGSELCRQILKLNPNSLILLEHNEPSLYNIDQELKNKKYIKTNVYPILGDACNFRLLNNLFKKYDIDIVFHAAAYKHVPIVEENPIEGISNNVLSTLSICEGAKNTSVRKVILISTDKAVRPTNIMGASKRLAELIIKSYAKGINKNILNQNIDYSMVRFGNVLGSSGSVVPLFKKQIKEGGPVTVTHKEINRYFMTIQEAALLVIHAAFLSRGGEIFLLDMGEPVKIIDLAEQMIRLSGLSVKNKENPNGDIEIIFNGIRPGEKLSEELLVDSKSEKTQHPLIYKAIETEVDSENILITLKKLECAILDRNLKTILDLLKLLVPEWNQ